MADAGADAGAGADADIQLLRRPETLTQLCDIVKYPYDDMWRDAHHCHKYKHMAETAAFKGREVSPELWAAGVRALTRLEYPNGNDNDRIKALAIIVPEVRATVCGDYSYLSGNQAPYPAWELLKIAYMICPKESPVFPHILYSLVR